MSHPSAPTLEALRRTRLHYARSWREIQTRHDHLLGIAAYPSSRAHHEEALRQLDEFGHLLHCLPPRLRRLADDSGITGSASHDPYDLGIARWLVSRFPKDVEIDWPALADSSALQELLRPGLHIAEHDGLDSDELSLRAWVRAARGPAWTSDLAWVLTMQRHAAVRAAHFASVQQAGEWESAAIPLKWRLKQESATTARLTPSRVVPRTTMRLAPKDPLRTIATPLRGIRRLAPRDAARVIDVARLTLAARCREVHAISYANPHEVWLAPLGRGSELAIVGVAREHRLLLEANYGYMLFSNGIPIGYGGVSPLFMQANTGINVFAPFRGTEAAYLWVQTLRAFHTLFGVRRFVVNAFQTGGGNAEALRSGAFWFHHRLGFRPTNPQRQELAARELALRHANPQHRSSLRVLRQLSAGDLHLTLPGFDETDAFNEAWLPRLSVLVSQRIGAVARTGARARTTSSTELGAQRRSVLAPFAALVLERDNWSATERRELRTILLAKEGAVEREFVLAVQAHPRFYRALIALAA